MRTGLVPPIPTCPICTILERLRTEEKREAQYGEFVPIYTNKEALKRKQSLNIKESDIEHEGKE